MSGPAQSWGWLAAGLLGALALGGRLLGTAARALDTHVDEAAGLVRAADDLLTTERVLDAAKTAKDLSPFVAVACAGDGAGRLAEAAARELRDKLGGQATVAVGAARTPRFRVRGKLLLVDVGETTFSIRSSVR